MTRHPSDPAAIKQATDLFRHENEAMARRALDQPEKYPHLQEWARRILQPQEQAK